jgi:hypothetical protein
MLYESTRGLLQSILLSLEGDGQAMWDDHAESGNTCLYEMHQMSGSLHKAYRSDHMNANSRAQSGFPQKLNRAMPHARMMVIAIRNKDRARAIESGKAALAEMNDANPSILSGAGSGAESGEAPLMASQQANTAGSRRRVGAGQTLSAGMRPSSGK